MKFYFRFLLCVFFTALTGKLLSQSRFVRNEIPNVASMLKHVDFPVNYYTGIPEIKLPLYNIKIDDFDFPLDLNYLSTGIKVNEASSNVGLGWSIGGLGVISRVVKGLPDDYNKGGYISTYDDLPGNDSFEEKRYGLFWSNSSDLIRNFNLSDSSLSYVKNQIMNIAYDYLPCNWYVPYHDTHPDIFYFSVNGLSGKFVFDSYQNTQKIELIPYQDIKITHQLDAQGKISDFQIIDKSGNQYFFNDVEEITDSSHDLDSRDGEILKYNSSWHLSKVVTNKNKTINLSYASESLGTTVRSPMEYVGGFGSASFTSDYIMPEYDFVSGDWIGVRETYTFYNQYVKNITQVIGSYTSPNVRRLSKISTDSEEIVFEANILRQDLVSSNSYAITGFKVYNKNVPNILVKGYELKYDYFNSDYVVNDEYERNKPFFKRLKLNSVNELGADGSKKLYAEFGYNQQHPLPNRLSCSQDIWGFYNGENENRSLIPTVFVYPSKQGGERFRALPLLNYTNQDAFVLPGAKRLPNEEFMLCGLLTKIKYLGGAERRYTYGMHDFRYPDHLEGGGARIERIDYYSQNKKELSRTYTYLNDDGATSSGNIVSIPTFAYPSGTLDLHYAMRFSVPQGTLSGTQGSYVGYKQVQEIITSSVDDSNSGKTVYYFDMPAVAGETNDITGLNLFKLPLVRSVYEPYKIDCSSANNMYVSFWNLGTRHYQLTADSPPFPEIPIYDWARGQLLKKIEYDKAGNILSMTENKYSAYFKSPDNKPKIVYGFVNKLLSLDSEAYTAMIRSVLAGHVVYSRYEYLTGVAKVLSETKTLTKLDGRDVVQKITYEYGSYGHMNKTKEYFVDSKNDSLLNEYYYVGDYRSSMPGPWEFTALMNTNRSGTLIEQVRCRLNNGVKKTIAGQLRTYQLWGNVLVPQAEYELMIGRESTVAFKPSTINESPETLSWDSRYRNLLTYRKFSTNMSLLEVSDKDNISTSYLWGFNGQYPIAEFKNASSGEVAFSTFENGDNGGWQWSNANLSTNAFEGKYSLSFSPTGGQIQKTGLDPQKKYRIRLWFLNDDWTSGIGSGFVALRTKGKWTLYETSFTGSSVYTYSNIDCMVDNVSICPIDAEMTSYDYEPGIGMKSRTDERGKTEYYFYDGFGRLKSILDQNKNVVKDYQYNYRP